MFALSLLAVGLRGLIAAEPGIAIEWDPHDSADGAGAVWLGYLMARTAYHEKHHLPLPASGEIIPTLDEEATARSDASTMYQELKATDKKLHDSYWDQMVQVKVKGYMPAYVWTYLRRASWSASKAPNDLAAFRKWSAIALKGHKPQTHGRLAIANK